MSEESVRDLARANVASQRQLLDRLEAAIESGDHREEARLWGMSQEAAYWCKQGALSAARAKAGEN